MNKRTQKEQDMYNNGHATGASKATRKKVDELRRLIIERFGFVQFTDSNMPNQDWEEVLDILRIKLLNVPG